MLTAYHALSQTEPAKSKIAFSEQDASHSGPGAECDRVEFMKLIDVVRDLRSFDDDLTIYAAEPWSPDSMAILAMEPPSGGIPAEALHFQMAYFIEVFIAIEFLEGVADNCHTKPSLEESCLRLIRYAIFDA